MSLAVEQVTEAPAPAGRRAQGAVVVSMRDASVRYEGCDDQALTGATLEIIAGERIALVGPSGGGKTTLLRCLEGTVTPVSGTVERRGLVTLVYQDLRLVPEQSTLDNVCCGALGDLGLFGGFLGFPAELRGRAEALLEDLGLYELRHEKVGCLSGGQRQRVAIARALIGRPAVVLADEPLAALDPENSRRILGLLETLQQKYGFALMVSVHDPGPRPDFFQRTLLVRDGQVSQAPDDALTRWDCYFCDEPPAHCALAEGAEVEACRRQDRALKGRHPLWRAAKWAGAIVLTLVALVWSVQGLKLSGGSLGAAFSNFLPFLGKMVPESWAQLVALPWGSLFTSLLETIQMAVLGTALGVVFSLPLSVLASRQGGPRLVRWPVRLVLNVIRTVPSIFWALLFVACVGLGPIAGVFALAAYSVGYLTKFYYEALENVDDRPGGALLALGASRPQVFQRAILPAARPALVGASLFVFEYNIRAASVLGVVGAGGIGQYLYQYFELRQFPAALAGLALILIVVVALDSVSEMWRRRLARERGT